MQNCFCFLKYFTIKISHKIYVCHLPENECLALWYSNEWAFIYTKKICTAHFAWVMYVTWMIVSHNGCCNSAWCIEPLANHCTLPWYISTSFMFNSTSQTTFTLLTGNFTAYRILYGTRPAVTSHRKAMFHSHFPNGNCQSNYMSGNSIHGYCVTAFTYWKQNDKIYSKQYDKRPWQSPGVCVV